MYFAEVIHDMDRRCINVFSNSELVNWLKQRLPDSTRSLLETNLRGMSGFTSHDLDHVKQYAVTAGTTARPCKASSASALTGCMPRQSVQSIRQITDNISMTLFSTSPPKSISTSASRAPHGMDPTMVQRLPVSDDLMTDIIVKMEQVMNIANYGQAFPESLLPM